MKAHQTTVGKNDEWLTPYYILDVGGTRSKANCGCTICLVAYGQDNLQALIDSKLGTVLKEHA